MNGKIQFLFLYTYMHLKIILISEEGLENHSEKKSNKLLQYPILRGRGVGKSLFLFFNHSYLLHFCVHFYDNMFKNCFENDVLTKYSQINLYHLQSFLKMIHWLKKQTTDTTIHANSVAFFSVSIDNNCQNIANFNIYIFNTNNFGQYLKISHLSMK